MRLTHEPVRRWGKAAGITGLTGLMAFTGITATPASAAPNFSIIVSKDDSIVLVDGVSGAVTVELLRNGVQIGLAEGLAAGGVFEVNHAAAPTECWDNFTPEILGGDEVVVTSGVDTDTVDVADLEVIDGATIDVATGIGTVKGVIVADPRPPIDDLSVETRSLTPDKFRALAPGGSSPGGVTGTLEYDDATTGAFTATFEGFSPDQAAAFLDSSDVSATLVTGGDGEASLSATAAVFGALAGSEDELCPATARRAVTTLSEGAINISNQGTALVIGGVSVGADAVDVTVTDSDGATRDAPAATLSGAGITQTWQTSLPPGALTDLADGPLTVSATYTEGANTLTGVDRTFHKDTQAPAAPTISPSGGTFTGSRQINIFAPDADIMYTMDGSAPGPLNGVLFGGPITLSDSATLRAVAIDAFDNASPVAQAVFTALTPPVPPAPVPPAPVPPAPVPPAPVPPTVAKQPSTPNIRTARSGAPGGLVTATARWAAPAADGGSGITGYSLTVLRIVDGKVVGRRTISVAGTSRSAVLTLRPGRYRFQVKAVNAVGSSSPSARSNTVTAR